MNSIVQRSFFPASVPTVTEGKHSAQHFLVDFFLKIILIFGGKVTTTLKILSKKVLAYNFDRFYFKVLF